MAIIYIYIYIYIYGVARYWALWYSISLDALARRLVVVRQEKTFDPTLLVVVHQERAFLSSFRIVFACCHAPGKVDLGCLAFSTDIAYVVCNHCAFVCVLGYQYGIDRCGK